MEGGDRADSAVSALFAMQGSKEVVNMNVGANPNYMGAYGSISGVVINADLDHDDNDDDDDDDNQYYYTSYSNPSPSPGARVKKGGEGGGEGGINSATSPSNDPDDRLQRSRERNRMHARKTRQRKKLQMQTLQVRAEELKLEQLRLKQIINDRKMANILLEITSTSSSPTTAAKTPAPCTPPAAPQLPATFDPDIEQILRRHNDDIPDGKKIMKETTAMVPSHKAKLIRSMSIGSASESGTSPAQNLTMNGKFPDDGIDYALLSKDRNKCTPHELDKIRKERNRMHAKRTRDRKKIFIQEMLNVIQLLDAENLKLRALIQQYYPENTFSMSTHPSIDPSQLPPPPITTYYAGSAGKSKKSASSISNASSTTSNGNSSSSATHSSANKTREAASRRPTYSHPHSTRSNRSAHTSEASSLSGKSAGAEPSYVSTASSSEDGKSGGKRDKAGGAREGFGTKRQKVGGDRGSGGVSYNDYSNSSDGGTSSDGHTDVQSNTTSNNTTNKSSASSSVTSDPPNSDGSVNADDITQ
ncbi:hypothetical protein TrCOL_g5071 [Triparma columacea]|uniref:BZIP domain-containing protein n=1 Tax=Triparma columacea TaxID=722753 RepID=A0A9W7GGR8_9STRA|nr:hypothetical protein TrCOL_g5071 [Triparma columacea]